MAFSLSISNQPSTLVPVLLLLVLLHASLCQPSHGFSRYGRGISELESANNCGELLHESQCSRNPKCSWCTSQYLDDTCFSKSEAWRLPQQVYSCGLIRMAPKMTFIADILPGRIDWKIKVRIIRLWNIPDFYNAEQTNTVEMVLLDERASKIQATVKRNLITKFDSLLEEGSSYVIENLLVANNDYKFKTNRHKYKLNFMASTKCTKADAANIPLHYFEFVPFPTILGGTEETYLMDAIGHVVKRDVIKETDINGNRTKLIDVMLEDLESNKIICTLWGGFAEQMNQFLDTAEEGAPVIVILQMCKLRKYHGQMGISNAFHGTKLFINPAITQASEYKERLDNGNINVSQVVSNLSGHTTISLADDLMETTRMTIADIIEAKEACFGSVLATIIDVDTEANWSFISCNKCVRKVTPVEPKNFCEYCQMMVTAVPRYKLPVTVMDKSGSTTFILFDQFVQQFLGLSAPDLILKMQKEKHDSPPEFEAFLNKEMLFKVQISKTNIDKNWQSYTVKKMSDKKELIDQFKVLHSIEDNGVDHNVEENTGADHHVVECTDSNIKTDMMQPGCGNSSDCLIDDMEDTPTSKCGEKRSIDNVEGSSLFEDNGTQTSSNKMPKIVVKKEPKD